jgi:hypothetical protein
MFRGLVRQCFRCASLGFRAAPVPVLVEICIGLEINGYMPADGYVPPEF